MMENCKYLVEMKRRIDNGEDPDKVIPHTFPFTLSREEYLEALYFARQVLPDGPRKDSINFVIERMTNASRRDSQL